MPKMNLKTMVRIQVNVILVCVCFITSVYSQNLDVALTVPEYLLQEGDYIELRGTFEGLSWDKGFALTKQEEAFWQIELTLPTGEFNAAEYKYVIIRKNGQSEWESGNNRVYSGGNVVNDTLRGFEGEYLQEDTDVTIGIDVVSLTINGKKPEQIAVMGERGTLGWDLPNEATIMNRSGDGYYTIVLPFPKGTPVDIPLKFAWQAEGVWHWEYLSGHRDHLLLLASNVQKQLVEFSYDSEKGRIVASSEQGLKADDYRLAVEIYGSARRYGYYLALQLLEQNDLNEARRVYGQHRLHYEPVYIDDFEFIWAKKISEHQSPLDALAFIEEVAQNEPNEWRRAYFQYLKGEILLEGEWYVEARQAFEQALRQAPGQDSAQLINGYAYLGIAHSFMMSNEKSEKMKSQHSLRELATEHPDEQMRRTGWMHLKSLGLETAEDWIYEEAIRELTQVGSPSQRLGSKLEELNYRMKRDGTGGIEEEILAVGKNITDESLKDEYNLLLADFYVQQRSNDKAVNVLREVIGQGRSNHNTQLARIKLAQLLKEEQ